VITISRLQIIHINIKCVSLWAIIKSICTVYVNELIAAAFDIYRRDRIALAINVASYIPYLFRRFLRRGRSRCARSSLLIADN